MNDKDVELLESNGWVVECRSPMEIVDIDTGGIVEGKYAIDCILTTLKNEIKRKNRKKKDKGSTDKSFPIYP